MGLASPYQEIWERALPYLQTRRNELHTRVCRCFAERLLAREGGREEVVLPAIVLHDIGWCRLCKEDQAKAFGPDKVDEELRHRHEVFGAELARGILSELAWPPEIVEEVALIIEGHDSRPAPLSHEDALVKDADKLWRFTEDSALLILQWFPRRPLPYLDWLEARIGEWFFTASAREIAREELKALREKWRKDQPKIKAVV